MMLRIFRPGGGRFTGPQFQEPVHHIHCVTHKVPVYNIWSVDEPACCFKYELCWMIPGDGRFGKRVRLQY